MTGAEVVVYFALVNSGSHEGLRCDHIDDADLSRWHALELARPDGSKAVFFCCADCRLDTVRRLPACVTRATSQ